MSNDVNKFQFRLVLLGSNGTGFLFKKFETKYKPTVEDLFSKDFDLGPIELKVDFLDTSGSMQFPAMRRLSITNGNAFMIVYSVDDLTSFEVLKLCVAEIQEARPNDYQELPIVFVGNKCDVSREERKLTKEQVSNFVYCELPRLRTKLIECSCKDNWNVEAIFKAYLSLAKVKMFINPPPLQQQQAQNTKQQTKSRFSYGNSHSSSGDNNTNNSSSSHHDSSQNSGANSPTPSIQNPNKQQRSSSIKLALGVRKSCDASIISSLRKVSIGSSSSSNNNGTSNNNNNNNNNSGSHNSNLSTQTTTTTTTPETANVNSNSNNNNTSNNRNNSREQLSSMKEQSSYSSSLEDSLSQQQQPQATEVILRDAVAASSAGYNSDRHHHQVFGRTGSHSGSSNNNRNKLSVFDLGGGAGSNSHSSKPRSRSLIWRPSRKSSSSSKNNSNNNDDQCRVT